MGFALFIFTFGRFLSLFASLSIMSSNHLLPNSYQTRPTNGMSTSYLTQSYQCQKCHRTGHITEICPNLPKAKKSRSGPVYTTYGHAPPTQLQRSYHLNGNRAGLQTWITPPTPYLSVPQPHQIPWYPYQNPQLHKSPHMVSDVEFPSLKGTSLEGSLLNSPLNVNPSITFIPTFAAPPSQTQALSPAPLVNIAAQGKTDNTRDSWSRTSTPAKEQVIFQEETSFFDQAWNDDCWVMPSSGTSPTDHSWWNI